ncbi:hypothetical protein TeGR_g4204 [Tetraparma gracilis]|uniref:Uncharacterized protein n=1 Tax=Tetraparma gracilis TaxID=2962635 RepID=A0ABQ6NBD3_9STRA|nr:hypothetical protein TeGR_g4204 [Tetraparma gracilis]
MDIIDSAYYLGLSMTPAELTAIIQELKPPSPPSSPPPSDPSSPPSSTPSSCPTTIRVFRLSPSEITEQIPQNIRLITNNCLPLAQHIIERAFVTALALSSLNTRRYIAIRHEHDPLDVVKITFVLSVFMSLIDIFLLTLPGIVALSIHGREALFLDIIISCRLLSWGLLTGGFVREAVWYSRREKTLEDELFRLKNRSHFVRVRTQLDELSAFEFVEELAFQSGDDELTNGILHRSNLFELIYHGRFPERRGSLHAGLASKISRHEQAMDKKYGLSNVLTGGFQTLSFSSVLVVAIVKGYVESGGTNMDAGVQSAATTQLVFASVGMFLIGTLADYAYIGEAVKDFRRHERVLLRFMQAVGHLNDADISAKGHPELIRRDVGDNESLRLTKETAGDLQGIFTIYDIILKYIRLRTAFHNSFFGFLILIDLAAAALFLVSATFDVVRLGPVATNLLFVFALVCAALLIAIARPLVRSSRLIHDDWLSFLIEHQLFLLSELASPANANALKEKQRQNYREQVQQLDAKIQQMRAQPAHIKVLGVEATTGSLARVLAAVAGSLLSGLMRQAADADS